MTAGWRPEQLNCSLFNIYNVSLSGFGVGGFCVTGRSMRCEVNLVWHLIPLFDCSRILFTLFAPTERVIEWTIRSLELILCEGAYKVHSHWVYQEKQSAAKLIKRTVFLILICFPFTNDIIMMRNSHYFHFKWMIMIHVLLVDNCNASPKHSFSL